MPLDVILNDERISGKAKPIHFVDILDVKTFIEADPIESRLWVDGREKMQRRIRRKRVGRNPEENSDCKNNRQEDDVDLA